MTLASLLRRWWRPRVLRGAGRLWQKSPLMLPTPTALFRLFGASCDAPMLLAGLSGRDDGWSSRPRSHARFFKAGSATRFTSDWLYYCFGYHGDYGVASRAVWLPRSWQRPTENHLLVSQHFRNGMLSDRPTRGVPSEISSTWAEPCPPRGEE